jgi:hypothetical protein
MRLDRPKASPPGLFRKTPELGGEEYTMRKEHHVFFLGGTGLRVAQAMVFACAHGLLPDSRLHLTVVDTDAESAIAKLEDTQKWYKHLHERWDMGLSRPEYAVLHGVLGEKSFNQNIDSGLYANPAVGAYLLHHKMLGTPETENRNDPLKKFHDAMKRPDQNEKVALCASSFGGTGVAAAEAMLTEFAPGGRWYQDQLEVGAFLLQPYFRIKSGGVDEHWDVGEAENRHLEAKRHYERLHDLRVRFVAPAHTKPWARGKYKPDKQENLPDLTEWMAAIQIAAWLQEENEEDTLKLSAEMMQACERFYELAAIWTRCAFRL